MTVFSFSGRDPTCHALTADAQALSWVVGLLLVGGGERIGLWAADCPWTSSSSPPATPELLQQLKNLKWIPQVNSPAGRRKCRAVWEAEEGMGRVGSESGGPMVFSQLSQSIFPSFVKSR